MAKKVKKKKMKKNSARPHLISIYRPFIKLVRALHVDKVYFAQVCFDNMGFP